MATPLRVLILADQPADAEPTLYELRRVGVAPVWERLETEAEYLAHLDQSLDIMLADYQPAAVRRAPCSAALPHRLSPPCWTWTSTRNGSTISTLLP
jgi:hypothetical protein